MVKPSPAAARPAALEVPVPLEIAQELWGHGNLSPVDDVFGSLALINLSPTKSSKLAVIARHMGRRLQRLSHDMKLWIDVFESEPELSRLQKTKDTKMTLKQWDNSEGLLGKNKFTEIIAFQTSRLNDSLPDIYKSIAQSLRARGQLFVGDLMLPASAETPAGSGELRNLHFLDDHKAALKAAGFSLAKEVDITPELVTTIRQGFLAGCQSLATFRALEEPLRRQKTVAFCTQLETWARAAILLETGRLIARGIVAAKRG